MAYLEEIPTFKQTLMNNVTNDLKLVEYIDKDALNDPDTLQFNRIYPFLYIPDPNEEANTYICCEVFVPYTQNTVVSMFEVHIYIFTNSRTQIYVDTTRKISCSRVDRIQSELIRILNGKSLVGKGYGMDSLTLKGSMQLTVNDNYHGKELVFETEGLTLYGSKCPLINK